MGTRTNVSPMAKKRRGRELPSEEDMTTIILNLKSHGEEMTALMGAAYLEHMLEEVPHIAAS